MNLSSSFTSSSFRVSAEPNLAKTSSVYSGTLQNAFQYDSLPFLARLPVESQPDRAWNPGNAAAFFVQEPCIYFSEKFLHLALVQKKRINWQL